MANKPLSPLDEVRVAIIRRSLVSLRRIKLNAYGYWEFSRSGLSRAAVDRAVNILVARGEAAVEPYRDGIIVWPVETGE